MPSLPRTTFYREVRRHIEHEDSLINQRMLWMIGLQSLLFGAYGLVVAAEASLFAARASLLQATPGTLQAPLSTSAPRFAGGQATGISVMDWFLTSASSTQSLLTEARLGFALMGMFSSAIVFLSLIAATMSMNELVRRWHADYADEVAFYPQIIGNVGKQAWWLFGRHGQYIGLVAGLALPVACFCSWAYLERSQRWPVIIGLVAGVLGYILLSIALGRLVSRTPSTQGDVVQSVEQEEDDKD